MGTPDFAKTSLEALTCAGEDVIAVVTKPDKPVGRKHIITPSPVKVYAEAHGIPVYQPTTLKDGALYEELKKLAPELIVVVAYGKILPQDILDYPKYGCINVHGSLLPKYRGAAPIQRSMLAGDDVTGVTTMYMDAGMDTGDTILSDSLKISDTENLEELYARLAKLGSELLIKTVGMIKDGTVVRNKQDDSLATIAPMLTKEDEHLDFTESTKLVLRRINCMLPSPAAYATLDGTAVKFYAAEPMSGEFSGECGQVVYADKKSFAIKTADGAVKVTELMREGGKRMSVAAYFCAKRISVGEKFC